MCGIYVFAEDRNIIRSFLIGYSALWPRQAFLLLSLWRIPTSRGVSPIIKKLLFFLTKTLETLILGWYCFSSLISFTFVLNLGSTSLRITGMVFLKEEGFGRAWVLEGLAVLAPGGE